MTTEAATDLIERLLPEGPRGLADLAKLMGSSRGGAGTHPGTLARWCRDGVSLPTGEQLKLEHFTCAGRLMSTKPALVRFLARQLAAGQGAEAGGPGVRTAAERETARAAADKELALAGC